MAHPLLKRLTAALRTYDWPEATAICEEMRREVDGPQPLDVYDAREVMKRLQLRRRFAEMRSVGDIFLRSGLDDPQIRRRYVQALIDEGELLAARTFIEALLRDLKPEDAEWGEAKGLLGRIYKQEYVESPRLHRAALNQAIRQYAEAHEKDPVWHGINRIALLARAKRDGLIVEDKSDEQLLARELLGLLKRALDRPDGVQEWERATLVEIHVALRDYDAAVVWAERYLQSENLEAFSIGSLRRQLEEVWQLNKDSAPGARLLPLLDGELLHKGGELTLGSQDIIRGLEADFGGGFRGYGWYRDGLERAKSVARIETRVGDGVGTGFLLDAGFFYPERAGTPVLLTNSHVISEDGRYPLSLAPEGAVAFFSVLSLRYRLGAVLDSSAPQDLDFSIVELDGAEGGCPCCPTEPPAVSFDPKVERRLYVIGHPAASGDLKFSLHDSAWLDANEQHLHYRTATDKGSSGSPVFDEVNWAVAGLHHRGKQRMPKLHAPGEFYEANEAVRLTAIQEYVRRQATAATSSK
jgi:hypothetical protein